MTLDADQHRALALLAKAGARGYAETMMQAHGFKLYMIAGLLRAEFGSAGDLGSAPRLRLGKIGSVARKCLCRSDNCASMRPKKRV